MTNEWDIYVDLWATRLGWALATFLVLFFLNFTAPSFLYSASAVVIKWSQG